MNGIVSEDNFVPTCRGFRTFQHSGGNTTVSIDANGLTGGASFDNVATLTGLALTNTDLTYLFNNGYLLAA